ncbi:tetratricopeptide repeat protein 39B-like isoform X1 [Petromyzon marinus]|uniref:Tetratricopeptide repeat protein 39B-like isoform X1 n=2 Tax=Petromyzon marinus TaxID=7757 RepID=A0AAJ7XAW3_PETMA|nr:tetratricopeptide repeat protein 39B-like isoform X1 [Petromyzon marinus]
MAEPPPSTRGVNDSGLPEHDEFEDAFEHVPVPSHMDLETGIAECTLVLNLFLNNKFSEALEKLQPWSQDSIYHALGYCTILGLQANMTFDPQDIANAIGSTKASLDACHKFRRKVSIAESLSSFLNRPTADRCTEEEMHAELCYAECLLQRAALTFIQDENLISFIRGGMKIRNSYQIYRACQQILDQNNRAHHSVNFPHFQGGVKLGIGAFNLMLSMLPSRVLRLLEFIGFSANKEFGLTQLREGAALPGIRAVLCVFVLLFYQTFICIILGNGDCNLEEAESLLQPYLKKYPNGALFLMYAGRIEEVKGNVEEAISVFETCIGCQQELKQLHHICFWEMMWCHAFQQNWLAASALANKLSQESRWSKAIYIYQKAAFLSMLGDEELRATGEDPQLLFQQVPKLMQKIAGKSIAIEKFAVRKSRRYLSSKPIKLILPAFEMMYVWNGFSIVGKRKDLTDKILVTIEAAEAALKVAKDNEFLADDQSLVQLLKGACLTQLGRYLQAELCFNEVWQSEKRIKYDHFLVPNALYELGQLHLKQGHPEDALHYLHLARNNYKNYSMESRLHFRLHAMLCDLQGSSQADLRGAAGAARPSL